MESIPYEMKTNKYCFLCLGGLPNDGNPPTGMTSFLKVCHALEIDLPVVHQQATINPVYNESEMCAVGKWGLSGEFCGGCKSVVEELSERFDELGAAKQKLKASLSHVRGKFLEADGPRVKKIYEDMRQDPVSKPYSQFVEVLREEVGKKCEYILERKSGEKLAALTATRKAAISQLIVRQQLAASTPPATVVLKWEKDVVPEVVDLDGSEQAQPNLSIRIIAVRSSREDRAPEEPQPPTSAAVPAPAPEEIQPSTSAAAPLAVPEEPQPSTSAQGASSFFNLQSMKMEEACGVSEVSSDSDSDDEEGEEGEVEEGEVLYDEENFEGDEDEDISSRSEAIEEEWEVEEEEVPYYEEDFEDGGIQYVSLKSEAIEEEAEVEEGEVLYDEEDFEGEGIEEEGIPSHQYGLRKTRLHCEHCDRKFGLKTELDVHIQRIHAGKTALCNICPKSFQTTNGLKIHFGRIHKGVKREPGSKGAHLGRDLQCKHCLSVFSRTSYYKHRRNCRWENAAQEDGNAQGNHPVNPLAYIAEWPQGTLRCSVCHKAFKKGKWLQKHVIKFHQHGTEEMDWTQ